MTATMTSAAVIVYHLFALMAFVLMATVSLYLDTRKANEDGSPVFLRISHKQEQRYVSLSTRVPEQDWHESKERVRKSHDHYAALNRLISREQSHMEEAVALLKSEPGGFTARDLKRRYKRLQAPEAESRESFLEYSYERISEYDKPGTRKNHKAGLNKFKRFLKEERGRSDVSIQGFTPEMIRAYRAWEKEVVGNAQNTVHRTLRTLRRMCNLAIEDGLLDSSDYPFEGVTLKRERTEKTPLSASEIKALEDRLRRANRGEIDYPQRRTLAIHSLRAWLFSCYEMGMRWGDVCTLTWNSIVDGRVSYKMRKTGAGKNVQLLPQAKHILDSCADRQGSHEFVFPFLDRYVKDPEWDLSQTEDLDNAINNRNSVINNRLGDIAEAVGINKNLTTHVARHSAANRMAANGWTLQEIQSALGHSDVTVTQEYIRTLRDDELDDKHREMF